MKDKKDAYVKKEKEKGAIKRENELYIEKQFEPFAANQTNHYFNEKELKVLWLSEDEINRFECFANLTDLEKENLSEFVYNLSVILYKSFKDESTGLFQRFYS
jgi:hypothetical protein